LAYLRIRPDATIAELAEKAGVSTRSVERNPRSLILSSTFAVFRERKWWNPS
jgi:predicted DNA-binding transcriptional regulator YafY